jgi:hypothetical protein
MKRFQVNNYKSISMPDNMYDDFMAWLDHECDGAEPTETLLIEFIDLEQTFSRTLRKAADRAINKSVRI